MLQIMSLLRGAKNLLAPWNKTIGFEAKRIPLGLDLSGSFKQIFHCVQDDNRIKTTKAETVIPLLRLLIIIYYFNSSTISNIAIRIQAWLHKTPNYSLRDKNRVPRCILPYKEPQILLRATFLQSGPTR